MSRPHAHISDRERDRAVEVVQQAYADGRFGPAELERQLEVALTATSFHELEPLVGDLPDDAVRLVATGGRIRRTGDWHVPRRLRIESEYGRVRLDLSRAYIPYGRVDIELWLGYGSAMIILPADASANADGVRTEWGKVTCKASGRQWPGKLHVEVTGELPYGRLTIRTARS